MPIAVAAFSFPPLLLFNLGFNSLDAFFLLSKESSFTNPDQLRDKNVAVYGHICTHRETATENLIATTGRMALIY